MRIRHRLWEFVTMICQNGIGQMPRQEGDVHEETVVSHRDAASTKIAGNVYEKGTGEKFLNREAEISRLTWAVLDGTASVADRRRLAEMVSEQHESRK